jgi:hypothetical protein
MRISVAICLICSVFGTSVFGQEATKTSKRENGSGFSSRDATVWSMMGWGVCLALGIALLCGSLEQNKN